MNASRWPNAVAGAGSVGSSAGTYTACTEVMAPLLGRGDPFLQLAHLGGQRRLITHGATACGRAGRTLREPACEKRKMLSMNSSVSAPVVSRKYSAIVRADRATRRRAPGGSFIWPKTMHGLVDDAAAGVADLGFLHFEPEVGAFAGPLADAGEHRVTAVRAGDAGDQLGEDDRLAEAGTAEQAGLAAADERREQVDDLDAGLEQLGLGREVGERAAARGGSASTRRRRPGRGRRSARRAG